MEDKAYQSQTNFTPGQSAEIFDRKSSQNSIPKGSAKMLDKPGKLSALPALDHSKQQEKLRKILGNPAEEAEEIMFNKKPKIGFSTRNSY